MISRINKVAVNDISRALFWISQKLNINYCFILHCLEENNDRHTVARILILEIMHCARNLQISQLSASRSINN